MTMKMPCAALGLVVALTGLAEVAYARPDDRVRGEVLDAQRRFFAAYQACDAQAMAQLTVDEMMFFHSTGMLNPSRTDFVKSFGGTCRFEELRFDASEVRIHGDTAVIYGDVRVKLKDAPPFTTPLKAAQVFVRERGRWLFLSNQSSEPIPLGGSAALPARGERTRQKDGPR